MEVSSGEANRSMVGWMVAGKEARTVWGVVQVEDLQELGSNCLYRSSSDAMSCSNDPSVSAS